MTIDWLNFTPWSSLAGGILIGLAAAALLLLLGRIAGISGIVGGLLQPSKGDTGWRLAFVLGLLAAPTVYTLFQPLPAIEVSTDLPVLLAAPACWWAWVRVTARDAPAGTAFAVCRVCRRVH